MSLAAGTRLGAYEITTKIGAGGMGEIYRARDTRLDRTVAVKVLPEALASAPEFHERFDREARRRMGSGSSFCPSGGAQQTCSKSQWMAGARSSR
jgi:serine/threonine protein kinase